MDEFLRVKQDRFKRLLAHVEQGLVDPDIEGWLVEINEKCSDVATTSSCSGRLAIIYSDRGLRDKRAARILAKWHDPRECRLEACKYSSVASDASILYWASLQPPVLHAITSSIESAESIVACALSNGLSRAGYKMYRGIGFHVEAGFHDKLHALLPLGCDILSMLCEELSLYQKKFYRFLECILETCIGKGKGWRGEAGPR